LPVDRVSEAHALAHHLLGALAVVPEFGILGGPVQLVQPRERPVPVKDASSAGPSPARSHWRDG
jgi:hypothetical protein